MFEIFSSANAWIALVTLIFLEIVLGIDNIIFISLAADKLPADQRKKATNIGLALAMILRIALLFGISVLISLQAPWFIFDWGWAHGSISGQSLILIAGGIFLLYKSTQEIYEKVEDIGHDQREVKRKRTSALSKVIMEITMINIVFSFDSILTAIGMTNGLSDDPDGALLLMIIAIVISVIIMLVFAHPVGKFVNKHPSVQVLGLAFLLLIGFMLIAEGAHMADLVIFNQSTGTIPKGYLYFAIFFSMFIEFLNFKLRSKKIKTKKTTDLLEEDEKIN
ncbi:TerC family protein [Nonlabens ulvanivorans]|uniref:Membrane protein n=3 Tax=Nonlabens ulvanivorans TaxID=906888 RepID=A0A084JWX9_NONUL|nr:TerC family protein [Nonlabens ulvanivorans]KEZ93463.1 membrane protein [Nonlabens ulvanivorans]PRX14053.1 putative tellurium resistance membrane protein TerC [Nonlabens ulvanivorans]